MNAIQYKYRINELLSSLPYKDHKKAIRVAPSILRISVPTFNNWRGIKTNDATDIPHEKVMMLERLFKLEPGQLANFTIDTPALSEIPDPESDEPYALAEKFSLSKNPQ